MCLWYNAKLEILEVLSYPFIAIAFLSILIISGSTS